MTKVYVASSWRNKHYPEVVKQLKSHGFDVYDFRNPPDGKGGFFWKDIDPNWEDWSTRDYIDNLHHPWAEYGFKEYMMNKIEKDYDRTQKLKRWLPIVLTLIVV